MEGFFVCLCVLVKREKEDVLLSGGQMLVECVVSMVHIQRAIGGAGKIELAHLKMLNIGRHIPLRRQGSVLFLAINTIISGVQKLMPEVKLLEGMAQECTALVKG